MGRGEEEGGEGRYMREKSHKCIFTRGRRSTCSPTQSGRKLLDYKKIT